MEVFGSVFDESVFEETRDRTQISLSPYKPRICEPQWFCENVMPDDDLEQQKAFKFRADLAYRHGEYEKALTEYTSCLNLVPSGNLTIRRDVLEGQARCHCRLHSRQEALEISHTLRKEATNTNHLTCVLNLQHDIHKHFGDVTEQIDVLQQLVCLHPYNPWQWRKLGEACVSSCSAAAAKGNADVWLKACVSWIRTRLLLNLLRMQHSSFVQARSEAAAEEVEEALRHLKPSEDVVRLITEVMAEDLVLEKMREESQDGESLTALCSLGFEERWYQRLRQML